MPEGEPEIMSTLRSPLARGALLPLAAAALAACSAQAEPRAADRGTEPTTAPIGQQPASQPQTGQQPAQIERCHVADLQAATNNPYKAGGMGNAGVVVTLTNTSGRTCTVQGYGGFGLLDEQDQTIATNVNRGPTYFADDPGRQAVTLAPGGSAYAALGWGIMGPDGDGNCDKVRPTLIVTPPDEEDYLTTALASPVCAGTPVAISGTAYAATRPS